MKRFWQALLLFGFLLPQTLFAQALFYQGDIKGGIATDSTGVSPPTYDAKFYRGPDLEMRIPVGATITRAWLMVYGGPNGLPVSSSSDTLDQVKLAGRTLREGGAILEREVRNEEGRRLSRSYNVTPWFSGLSPNPSAVLKVSIEEQGRADTSEKSSVSIQGEQLIVLYSHAGSPPRHVSILFGYAQAPTDWSFSGLPVGSDRIDPVGLLSTTFIFNNACDQIGLLELSGQVAPTADFPLVLTRNAGGRDDGIYSTNVTCSPKGEDTNSLITTGSFGFLDDDPVGAKSDSPSTEPAGDLTNSRLSDELFRIPYDAAGSLRLQFTAEDITNSEYELKTGYLATSILVLDYIDTDRDGILDWEDLCPLVADPAQGDLDEDGLGDLCDSCTDQDDDGAAFLDFVDYGTCLGDCDDLDPRRNPFTQETPYNGVDEDCIAGDLIDVDNDGASASLVGGPDCDDQDPTRGPSRIELCDGIDQDCDSKIDEDFDADGDGYSAEGLCPLQPGPEGTKSGTDCDDTRATVYPTALELCDDLDNNCDGTSDEGLQSCPTADLDEDGYSPARGDCDDDDASLNPSAQELCDGVDNNCLSGIDEPFDTDRDGHFSLTRCPDLGDDCDDSNALTQPGAVEVCDGQDNNCNLSVDEGLDSSCPSVDADADGFRPLDGDCNDQDSTIHPGVLESCDELDNNCNAAVDEDFDIDGDGFLDQTFCGDRGLDCDDLKPQVQPGATDICDGLDNDCDGRADEDFDRDKDGYLDAITCPSLGTDCYDRNAGINPGAIETCNGLDNDCSGAPAEDEIDADGDGSLACAGDCDDTDPTRSPLSEDLCDGLDNNCDGRIDEGFDADLDGYSDANRCPSLPPATGTDCDDTDPSRSPAAIERCDGRDDNCDGQVDEAFDLDQDGAFDQLLCSTGTDCDDSNSSIALGQDETCDGLDNDCNGTIDENLINCESSDKDHDGFSTQDGDCDDLSPAVYPGAIERCDTLDNNCVAGIDEGFDQDADGYQSDRDCALGTDCNDQVANINPDAPEVCDNLDNDCDGERDEGLGQSCASLDLDGDGFTPRRGDCNDADSNTYPGAPELCDGTDQSCNGTADEGFDFDGDGYTDAAYCPTGTDCNDLEAEIHPDVPELCNGLDDDCDDTIDDGYVENCQALDLDGDGYRPLDGDCDDSNPQTYPGAEEICDGIDQDCTGIPDEPFDVDEDGYTDLDRCLEGTDCNDLDPDVHPGVVEECDGIDNDCNFAIDETFDFICRTPDELDVDLDDDGFTPREGDCIDFDPDVYPGALERCNDRDDDCDGDIDDGTDKDYDGCPDVNLCPEADNADCDDTNRYTSPRHPEQCGDGIDNNCDDIIDPEELCAITPEPTATPPVPEFQGGGVYCSQSPSPQPSTPWREAGLLLLVGGWMRRRKRP